jgi:hypothetical protein
MMLYREHHDVKLRQIRTGLSGGEGFHQALLRQGEKAGRLLALHAGEVGQKGVKCIAFRDVVKKGLERHTRARKARGSVHDVGIDADDLIEAQSLQDSNLGNYLLG